MRNLYNGSGIIGRGLWTSLPVAGGELRRVCLRGLEYHRMGVGVPQRGVGVPQKGVRVPHRGVAVPSCEMLTTARVISPSVVSVCFRGQVRNTVRIRIEERITIGFRIGNGG